MRHIGILFVASFLSFYGCSTTPLEKVVPDYSVGTSKVDSSLKGNEAIYTFEFKSTDNVSYEGREITYQIDSSVNLTAVLKADGIFQVKTTAGKHEFIVFFDRSYKEIYTLEIPITALNNLSVFLNLKYEEFMIIEEKPVIYLYPEKETKVKVEVEPKGEFTYTYPKYENGWTVTAQPDGKITHNGNRYNYLFWEAKQNIEMKDALFSEGFIIEGSKTQDFLEEQLTAFGFTSEEKADFITYWGPRIATDGKWFIRFVINEECNQFADLKIEPQTKHVYRFYILAKELTSETKDKGIQPKTQKIEPMKREGFVVLEWGGSIL